MDNQPAAASTQTPTKPRKAITGLVATVAILVVGSLLVVRMGFGGGTAASPEFMPVTTNLASMTFDKGTPVVAVVTADWCGPCQNLKRTTLADERVRDLLSSRAQPVMIDGTSTEAAMPTLQKLGIRAFPSTVIVRDGQPVAMLEGYASADKYLAWLEQQL